MTIPKSAIGAVAEGKIESMTISTPVATYNFDDKALKAIAREAKDDVKISASIVDPSTLSLSKGQLKQVADRPVYDFKVTSGNKEISNFRGGIVTIEVPYTLKAGEREKSIAVYYLNKNGNLKHGIGKFESATGTVKMTIRNF